MIDKIQKKFKAYIKAYDLLHEGDKIIVGVSGGADSVALLDLLYSIKDTYRLELEIAHIHHGLRAAADEEVAYVKHLGESLGLKCHVHYCNIQTLAKTEKLSEEEAGRNERYKFFISLTNEYAKIATAHTANDQAETLIMRFLRGSDVKGLGGILPKRDNIIRPLLCLTREEVEIYCEERQLHYHQDESNFEKKYTRNKVRLECLPYIKTHFNEGIIRTLSEHATLYQEEEAFLEDYIQKCLPRIVSIEDKQAKINIEALKKETRYIQKKLIYKTIECLGEGTKDLSLVHINDCLQLCEKQSGRQIILPNKLCVKRVYDFLRVEKRREGIFTNYENRLQLGINKIEMLEATVYCELVDRKTFEQSNQNMYTKYIDYDKIKDNLRIRNKQSGDKIALEYGSKTLKKLLSDAKIPADMREQIPVIVDGEWTVWAVGVRLSSQYFVTEDTKHILEIKILKRKTQEGLC